MGIFNKQGHAAGQHAATTLIAEGCFIQGELELGCDMQVDGRIEGKLTLEKHLLVSQQGRLKGEIQADKIVVNGLVEGSCRANVMEILENGVVSGTIFCDNLSIERGGKFLGTTHATEQEQVVELIPKEKAVNSPS